MIRFLSSLVLSLLLSVPVSMSAAARYILVKAGDAESLLEAISLSGVMNADSLSKRLYILIPDGVYDLGERVLTTISGHNVALIGQSMEGTVIRNCPPVEKEGIGTTAVLLNRGHHTYVQDLTLKNDLDYYNSGAAGRAVCWQDKGSRTIFKRVRMLSYQDTYYSYNEDCQHYLEDSEIHGTVDFICGAGDVFFNRCLLVTEKRDADGQQGRNVIAAPRTSTTLWGFVFYGCTIRNIVSKFHLARGWHTHPRCTWINTVLETPEKLEPERFEPQSIRSEECEFGEYGTTDALGRSLTPDSNIITLRGKAGTRTVQTTLQADSAARFTLRNVFPDWKPDKEVRRIERQSLRLVRRYLSAK